MNKVVVIFPTSSSLADFVISHNISNAEINSVEKTLIAPLDDDDILTAIVDYGGHLNVERFLKPATDKKHC